MNPNSVDLSLLEAFPGHYNEELFTALYNSFDAINDFTFWPGLKNTEKLTKFSVNSGAKPHTGIFAPATGDLQYTGQDITVQPWQRDIKIVPSLFRQSFMAYNRGKGEGADNLRVPFEEFVWRTIFGNLAAGINNKSIYFGVGAAAFAAYNPATAYAVGNKIAFTKANEEVSYYYCKVITTAGQTPETHPAKWENWDLQAIMVGYGAILAAGITAGKLNPFVTGVIDASDNAYQIQKDLFRQLTEPVQDSKELITIFQSRTDYWLLTDAFEDRVSKYTEKDASGITYLAGTDRKCIVKPVTSMAGSRRLIATRKSNMIIGTDELSDFNTVNVVKGVYHLDAGISGVIGVGIKDLSEMIVSDQV
jgi:hypothetical protein